MKIDGICAIVTGAAGGIGKAVVERLLSKGAKEAVISSSYLAKKYMSKQNGGSGGVLINVSSVAGYVAAFDPIYAASKHGVQAFSLALTECDPSFTQDDIRVGVICPCYVHTPLIDTSPVLMELVKTAWEMPMSVVVDAFLLIIEDDTKHGCCVRITKGKGIDLLPMKTVSEWASELQFFKS